MYKSTQFKIQSIMQTLQHIWSYHTTTINPNHIKHKRIQTNNLARIFNMNMQHFENFSSHGRRSFAFILRFAVVFIHVILYYIFVPAFPMPVFVPSCLCPFVCEFVSHVMWILIRDYWSNRLCRGSARHITPHTLPSFSTSCAYNTF